MTTDARHGSIADLWWPKPLFPYQKSGIQLLCESPSMLLADEMGLGKTIQAIGALRSLFVRNEIKSALVVVPAGLVLQWRRELRTWAPELKLATILGSAGDRALLWRSEAQVYVASYERIRSDSPSGQVARRRWDVVILDEAQRIKNPDADVAHAIKRLARVRSWALTGTPLENSLDDLVSILDFVAPGRFDRRRYARGLRDLLSQVQLRRYRTDVQAELPPKLVSEVLLDLSPAQRRAYDRAENDGIIRFRDLGVELRVTHVLELMLRLKQICNFCPESGTSAKLADLRARLAEIAVAGQRALVFSQFTSEAFGVRRLARELVDFDPLVLSGSLDAMERTKIIRTFESTPEHKALLVSLRAGGLGLNLTMASFVVHFDRWWNPAVESQAEHRAHRIGQVRPVSVYAYLCENTVEVRIAEILREKQSLFSDIVDGVALRRLGRLDLATLLRAIDPRAEPLGSRNFG